MRRVIDIVVLTCALGGCLPGCAASTRRDVGTVIAATGGLTALTGAGVAMGCTPFDSESESAGTDTCETDGLEPNPEVGLPVLGIGLGIAIIGAVVYGTGVTPPAATPAPSKDEPAPSEYLY